jgi:hypothetical protein
LRVVELQCQLNHCLESDKTNEEWSESENMKASINYLFEKTESHELEEIDRSVESRTNNLTNGKSDIDNLFTVSNTIARDLFESRIPKWGANIVLNKTEIEVTNTCTIDYYLFAMWILNKIHPIFIESLHNKEITAALKKIIRFVDVNKWDLVRQVLVIEVLKKTETTASYEISLFGSLSEAIIKYFLPYQAHT